MGGKACKIVVLVCLLGGCAESARRQANSEAVSATHPAETAQRPLNRPTTEEEDPFDHPVLHRPIEAIDRAVLISVDGLRPDMLLRSDTPNMHRLSAYGSFTFWARTTANANTLPSHTSMVTGVTPRRHEIEWNRDLPFSRPVYPMFPTVMESLHRAGYTTAMCAGKSKFDILAKPGTLDWIFVPDLMYVTDTEVARHAVTIIREHHPDFLFVHLAGVDVAGHASGWGSHPQREAAAQADVAIGEIIKALEDARLSASTFVLLTADHGGAGRNHLPDDPRALTIPWIALGPGIRQDLDLTTFPDLTIHTEDTCATIRYIMGLPEDSLLDGRPIRQIVEKRELLEPGGN